MVLRCATMGTKPDRAVWLSPVLRFVQLALTPIPRYDGLVSAGFGSGVAALLIWGLVAWLHWPEAALPVCLLLIALLVLAGVRLQKRLDDRSISHLRILGGKGIEFSCSIGKPHNFLRIHNDGHEAVEVEVEAEFKPYSQGVNPSRLFWHREAGTPAEFAHKIQARSSAEAQLPLFNSANGYAGFMTVQAWAGLGDPAIATFMVTTPPGQGQLLAVEQVEDA